MFRSVTLENTSSPRHISATAGHTAIIFKQYVRHSYWRQWFKRPKDPPLFNARFTILLY